jgi:hypothetical protein
MNRTLLALLAPPAAVARFGCATCTAAPIGVFWLAGLVSIGYGLAGGAPNALLSPGGLIVVGVSLWLIATAWARLVIRGVESDLRQHEDSTRVSQVTPRADEPDPFSQIRSNS